jgi:hypothetical protein
MKMHSFVFGIGEAANWPAILPKSLEKSHCLKEFKRTSVFSQDLLKQGTV